LDELNELKKRKINYSELLYHVDLGRQQKYEIPEETREQMDEVNKLSKEIKK